MRAVPRSPRDETVLEHHSVLIRTEWWRDELGARHLPGRPPSGDRLTRADVWAPGDDVFTLLWRTLAWGSGSYLRLNARRLTSIAADVPRCENLLTRAADLSTALRPPRSRCSGRGTAMRSGTWARRSSPSSCTSPVGERRTTRA
ncbi:hypothetical protein SK854_35765 [Lentzea sp. BCCO 10_0061]|uniref:Uncharacterized protein n=1 Tax=Lentzea sokolovensis TaxID=3095429 RepID=A0ABU4V9F5_9PSEU|nr:hypothetical protein [Lentzea sp. BCCO 10_0061]MDX8147515.1 hypothetical protein [Lentzea sp. BCCO 10_0061]